MKKYSDPAMSRWLDLSQPAPNKPRMKWGMRLSVSECLEIIRKEESFRIVEETARHALFLKLTGDAKE